MMTALRYLALVALALWVGGLVALALAAPQLFDVLQTHDVSGGRELAGRVFGALFNRFQHVTWGLGAVLLVSLGTRAALGPRPRRFAVRMWTVSAMLAASVVTSVVLTPRIERIRDEVAGPVATLAREDPRAIELGRLHTMTTALMLVTVLAGVALMWVEMRDTH